MTVFWTGCKLLIVARVRKPVAAEVMNMAWEKWQRRIRPSTKDPMVTLSKSGLIGLNSAIARNILGDSKYAVLLFDRQQSLVGIKLLKANEPDAYPIKVTKSRSHAALSGLAFMKSHGLVPQETTAFPADFEPSDGLLVVDVSALAGLGKGPKRKVRT